MKILSIGEILWDVFEGAEHLGGAPFNFAAHARRLGHEVLFLSAVGSDARGRRAVARLSELGLPTHLVARVPNHPTGFASVELGDDNQPRYVIHRPAAYDCVQLDAAVYDEISNWKPAWIYFGTLHQMHSQAKECTERIIAHCPGAKRFYDLNLRAGCYTAELVRDLMRLADVVKLNEAEVASVGHMLRTSCGSLEQFCRQYAETFHWQAVCVTRGVKGCALLVSGEYAEAPGYAVQVRDTIGAGDAFSAAFLHGLGNGWPAGQIADFANRVGALVASREGAVPWWEPEECRALMVGDPAASGVINHCNRRILDMK